MGLCSSCFDNKEYEEFQVDPETRRNLQFEAAEKRRLEAEKRGIKNPEELKRKEQRMRDAERVAEERQKQFGSNDNTLKWQVG